MKKEKTICPTCFKEIKDLAEINFLEEVGECLRCDHVRGDNLKFYEKEKIQKTKFKYKKN